MFVSASERVPKYVLEDVGYISTYLRLLDVDEAEFPIPSPLELTLVAYFLYTLQSQEAAAIESHPGIVLLLSLHEDIQNEVR